MMGKPMQMKSVQHRNRTSLAFACVMVCGSLQTADAQTTCSWTTLQEPVRQAIRCGEMFSVEREADAGLSIVERSGDAPPRAIELQGGAALIEVTPGAAPTQIRTPHAIAAVRGTTYIVDVGPSATSVFVLEGKVNVRKPTDASTVSLGPGEGVDVALDDPLNVVTWGAPRVAALLARFGR